MHTKTARDVKKRVVLTGGHAATTATSVIEEILRRGGKSRWEIYWIGAAHALEGKSVPTLESEIFPKMGVSFHPIIAGRLQRRFTLWTIPSLFVMPIGFFQSLILLLKIKPGIIVSFGGSPGFPVVVTGWLLGIPVLIHEQTTVAGAANRLSSFFARKIALAREESRKFFPSEKSLVVGNPILSQIKEITPKDTPASPPTLLITGGSRGSQTINENIEPILKTLLKKFYIVHLTGFLDFEKFKEIKKKLSGKMKERYEIYPLVDPMEIDNLYRQSDLIISRAGANTISEIIVTKRPAIVIPIPWSYLNEQAENADFAEKFGNVRVVNQDTLNPERLLTEIDGVMANWEKMVKVAKNRPSPDTNAEIKLVDLIEDLIQ